MVTLKFMVLLDIPGSENPPILYRLKHLIVSEIIRDELSVVNWVNVCKWDTPLNGNWKNQGYHDHRGTVGWSKKGAPLKKCAIRKKTAIFIRTSEKIITIQPTFRESQLEISHQTASDPLGNDPGSQVLKLMSHRRDTRALAWVFFGVTEWPSKKSERLFNGCFNEMFLLLPQWEKMSSVPYSNPGRCVLPSPQYWGEQPQKEELKGSIYHLTGSISHYFKIGFCFSNTTYTKIVQKNYASIYTATPKKNRKGSIYHRNN